MSSLRRQQGFAIVELAISISLLMLLLMVTGEFGRVFYQYNELTKSVYPATRYLSEHAYSSAGVFSLSDEDIAIAKNLVVYGSPQSGDQPRFPSLSTANVTVSGDGTHVTIGVEWAYRTLFGGEIPSFQLSEQGIDTNNLVLQASLTMRALN